MPSMITVCPGCGRKGIMAKATGKCFHCNKAAGLMSAPKARTPKVTIVAVAPAVVTPVRSSAPAPDRPIKKNSPLGRLGKRIIGGRLV